MKEFGGYQIQSDEYRLMNEQLSQENERLMYRESVQRNEITFLKKKLLELKQQLQNKDDKINQLQENLDIQKLETKSWEDKYEMQTLKTERAHQVRMEADEKVVQLERICENMRKELVKSSSACTIVKNRLSTLHEKIKEQGSSLEHFIEDNKKLEDRVADLTDLCKRANKRIESDEIKLAESNDEITTQKDSLDLWNKFAASVQERESRIEACLERIVNHYESKLNKRCFFLKRQHKSHTFDLIEQLVDIVGTADEGVVEAEIPSSEQTSSEIEITIGDPGRQLM